jgi:homocysteine S-methyltransferase
LGGMKGINAACFVLHTSHFVLKRSILFYQKAIMHTLFSPFTAKQGVVILDGALATELEQRGANLNDALWSAKLLSENPDLIRQVHYDYILAGANVITTASYQASYPGFAAKGYTSEQATALMRLSVHLAQQAREQALAQHPAILPPLIAASVGPYGAYLADGSEYKGHYGLSVEELMNFHRPRLRVLLSSGAGLLACETIPCMEEALALTALLKETPEARAWLSFSCRNERENCQGDELAACIAQIEDCEQLIAVGINCTAPQYVEALVTLAAGVTQKPIVAYANRGEVYDAVQKCWLPGADAPLPYTEYARRWYAAGARLIGGCCRTGPGEIRELVRELAG